jgi:hypothetical protein
MTLDLVLEYRDPETTKLYHHKMKIKKLRKETTTKEALDYLKKKHYHFFIPKIIDEQQIESNAYSRQNSSKDSRAGSLWERTNQALRT